MRGFYRRDVTGGYNELIVKRRCGQPVMTNTDKGHETDTLSFLAVVVLQYFSHERDSWCS